MSLSKRKRRCDKKLYKTIGKLEKEKLQLHRKCGYLRNKIARESLTSSPLTPKRKTLKTMRAVRMCPGNAPEIQKQLLFVEAISREI